MSSQTFDDSEFEHDLDAVERSLQDLKDRYRQVRADQTEQQALLARTSEIERELRQTRLQPLRDELKQLQQRLEELEIALESHLFSWKGVREGFWQVIRFGGLGIILGWIMKSCAG